MIDANFYDLWIKNTKSPFSRSSKIKDLDKAIKGFCESIGKSKEAVATKTLLEAWDAWQTSKEFEQGWWYSDRKSKSTNGVVRILSNELLPLFQQHKSSEPRTMIDDPVCYDSPHRRRAENHGAEMAFSLSPLALEVWNISKTSRQRGDTFIGCTDLSTGVCHMLPTYEQMVAEKLGDTALVHNPVFLKSPQRTYADIKDTFGAPPRFGNVGIKFIVGPKQEGIDGYYHNALMRIVGVHGDNALGWGLQGCYAHGAGLFRFVSSKNSGKFDLPNSADHEGRDLPPAWAKAISECVARTIGIKLEDNFAKSVSGKNLATRVRKFSC